MATVSKWTPFGVALDITATGGTVTRTSATKFTVKINASWETYYSGAQTNYGMTAASGGVTSTISAFTGAKRSSGSSSFTGTYSISGNGSATKTITVTFRNFNTDNGDSATKSVSFTVSVPAWTSYKVTYNANGGSGAPGAQTKWKDQTLTLSSTKPTRTGYSFQGWGTSASDTSVNYAAGASYTANAAVTLYAIWKANTYKVTYNSNGGSGAPSTQTKTYGVVLTLSSVKPTRTNYTFKGWSTSATTSAVAYAPGASYTSNAAITLYAVWELTYYKPRISNVSVVRCDSDGVETDDGKNALVKFSWYTAIDALYAFIEWEYAGNTYNYRIDLSGTSGTVEEIVGNDALSEESAYTIIISVYDYDAELNVSNASYVSRSLPGISFPLDVLAEGKGIAFGKAAQLEGVADFGYETRHRKDVTFENNLKIFATNPEGVVKDAFNPMNQSGNCVLGYGNYDLESGNTNVYGHDINFGVSNIASKGTYRPYRRREDSVNFYIRTAGYVTNSKQDVSFLVPFSVPIVGSPTVSVTSIRGFVLRQNDTYTHGSAASTYVVPDSYTATVSMWCGVYVTAKFSTTTNATNNSPIGIYWEGTITFS